MPDFTIPVTIKVVGEAGEGIITTGDLIQYAVYLYGLHTSSYKEFPSNIRGGYTASIVRISTIPLHAPRALTDLCILHSQDILESELRTCNKNARCMLLSDEIDMQKIADCIERSNRNDITVQHLSEREVISGTSSVYSSSVAGIIGSLLNIPFVCLEKAVYKFFEKKGEADYLPNLDQCRFSYKKTAELLDEQIYSLPEPSINPSDYTIIDGNLAAGKGTIAAGCSFFSSYPITPATTLGSFLAVNLPDTGGVSLQVEDEIAAIGSAIGASFAGAQSLTVTSGPGLSLMQEFIGYSSMVELPVVIIDVQRAGPSTGSPTRFGQEDLFAVCFGSHGESPRVVLSPVSIEDCFSVVKRAFSTAQQYQCPVIVLSDSILGSTKNTVPISLFSDDNKIDVVNNIRPIPGKSNTGYIITGVEHDQDGFPTDKSSIRIAQQQRRFQKLDRIEHDNSDFVEWDCDGTPADIALISWGINASVVKDTVRLLRNVGVKVTALYPRLMFPACKESLYKISDYCKNIVVIESNFYGQYGKLIRMFTDVKPESITSMSGCPFTPEELYGKLSTMVQSWKQ